MKTIIAAGDRKFEVVDHIPDGFTVWNIGENMGTCDYIPLCEKMFPGNKECYDINPGTLKALPLPQDDVLTLRKAAGYGVIDLKSARRALNRTPKTRHMQEKQEFAKLAIEIFKANRR